MPRVSELFPTRFISAGDLKRSGKDGIPLVIKGVEREEGRDPKTKKKSDMYIVYFQGATKGHRIRKSEARALERGFGATTEEWAGKEAVLYVVPTQVGEGVRMRPAKEEKEAASA